MVYKLAMTSNVSLTFSYASPPEVIPDRAAIAVILKEDNVLLVTRHDGRVLFPGGGVNAGETDQKTAIRETGEETGVGIRVVYELGQEPHRNKSAKTVSYLLCEHKCGDPVNAEPDTHESVQWVPISQAIEMMGEEMTSPVRAYLVGIQKRHSQLRT
jgi:8-oxo-dGTP pyrophosphatase MutT (NUDIX family)